MSLDVYLIEMEVVDEYEYEIGDFTMSVTATKRTEVYWANITHNLNTMAERAGIYKHLWKPEELNITKASELIEPLGTGLQLMLNDPKRFIKFNPSNGWGNYDSLVSFIAMYLIACKENPNARIDISR